MCDRLIDLVDSLDEEKFHLRSGEKESSKKVEKEKKNKYKMIQSTESCNKDYSTLFHSDILVK